MLSSLEGQRWYQALTAVFRRSLSEVSGTVISLAVFFGNVDYAQAQAPVSDLTGYPSGLASIAVVAYYAVQSEKDDLWSRRSLAGFGTETIGRDLSAGPRKLQARDLQIKGLTINRDLNEFQRDSWNWRTCGKSKGGRLYNNRYDNRPPLIDGRGIVEKCAEAFADMPDNIRTLLALSYGWGTEGHCVAALAAFCQITEKIPDASICLKECATVKQDFVKMQTKYIELKRILDEKTIDVSMPEITGKPVTELEGLYVMAYTWEGGGRPVHIPCSVFIQALGYCVGFSYGGLLASAHYYLTEASWAGSFQVQFLQPVDSGADQSRIMDEVQQSVRACHFYGRECDLRVWHHRFGDHLASLVAGCLIASLVCLGSTSGSWVAVTAAAIADPKPVAGLTSAAWGYPRGRRAHMEAHSNPTEGQGIVCIKRQTPWQTFQPLLLQDLAWQAVVGSLSIITLTFKFTIRNALGFGPFQPPAEWIVKLCLATATLGVLIDLQVPYWARSNGARWSFAHSALMVLLEIACIMPKYVWRDQSEATSVLHFWLADACAWIHCLLSGLFSIHLSQASEYPVMGWVWPSAWLFAFASCGSGYPRSIPPQ